jgi:hypothetical protein
MDIAAMTIQPPSGVEISPLPSGLLATESDFVNYELRPGDELLCVGFPLGMGVGSGCFPILRSGRLASYPVTPVRSARFFLFDFAVYPGNSGGPVYHQWAGKGFEEDAHFDSLDERPALIVGLVSESYDLLQSFKGVFETRMTKYPLELGVVIPAPFIRDVIRSMHL